MDCHGCGSDAIYMRIPSWSLSKDFTPYLNTEGDFGYCQPCLVKARRAEEPDPETVKLRKTPCCGKYIHGRLYSVAEDKWWCAACVSRVTHKACTACFDVLVVARIFNFDTMTLMPPLPRDERVCGACMERMVECDDCGARTNKCNVLPSGGCLECYDDVYQKHDWRYKPRRFRPLDSGKGEPTIGIEVEFYMSDRSKVNPLPEVVMTEVMSRTDPRETQMYIMHDGTVKPGFEIVAHPVSFDMLKQHRLWKAIDIINEIADTEPNKAFKESGVHIHISRKDITKKQLFLMMKFCYNNIKFITKVGGRGLTQHCQATGSGGNLEERIEQSDDGHLDKYELINLKHRETVEFRWFKSIMDVSRVMSFAEFVHALYMYTKKLQRVENLSVKGFKAFVKANRAEYYNLHIVIGGT